MSNVITNAIAVLGGWAERLTAEAASSEDAQAAKEYRAEARRTLAAAACLTGAVETGRAVVRVGNLWRIPSEADPRRVYMASDRICGCQAGSHGRECKHMIAARAMQESSTSSADQPAQAVVAQAGGDPVAPFIGERIDDL